MSEQKIRSGRKQGFVVLMRGVAQDQRLSLEARGLFALMVSLPEGWEFTVSGLAGKAGCGKDKVRRLLGELQDVGYLIREQSHDSGGKFGGNIYVLQDEAPLSGNPDNGETEKATVVRKHRQREKPSTEKPLTGIPTQNNKDIKNIDIYNTPYSPPKGARRRSKYDLAEDAKPILRAYVGEDRQLAAALGAFIEVRVQLRAINSAKAVQLLLGKLDKLSGGDRQMKLQLLAQSVESSWKGLFPLKGGQAAAPSAAPARVEEEGGTYLL